MLWVQSKLRLTRAGLAGALLSGLVGAAPAMAKDALIVKSTVAEYQVGSKVSEKDEITLRAGDVVSVLTRRGTRTMRGPGTFIVGANPKSNRTRFANLTRKGAALKTRTGGVRSVRQGGKRSRPQSPNLYYLDVEREGPVCLRDLSEVFVWRPYNANTSTYALTEAASEGTNQTLSLSIVFPETQSTSKNVSQRFAMQDGRDYTISNVQNGTVTAITVIDLGSDIRRADALAEVLYQKGCIAQFELLAEQLAGGS